MNGIHEVAGSIPASSTNSDKNLARWSSSHLWVAKVLGEPTGIVRGKPALRECFRNELTAFPMIEIELIEVYLGLNSRVVHFQTKGRKAKEVMELNQAGEVHRAMTLGQP